jgi:hypothetical protein
MTKSQRWSDADTKLAIEMIDSDAPEREFLKVFGRTKNAAYSRARYVTDAEFREKRLLRDRANRARNSNAVGHIVTASSSPPAHIFVEARERANAPRSLTAWLCGDPAPGTSMLDRRKSAGASA